MHIRELTLYDIDKVQLMIKDLGKDEASYDKIKRFLSEDEHHLIAALDQGKIIGFALAYELPRIDGKGNMLYVHEIDVAEEYRRQGIGKSLMDELNKLRINKNMCKMFLLVDPDNSPAIGLYETCNGLKSESLLYTYE
ncbi:GNAT family N-acetyltransferase [Vallitalea okinawensis]|uniref:GNAT family N-acetyltransferase n=1 Tax=Vallitalea okinawensis TaxID=2078660 RepID=UPI000CFBDD7A|nr:GNAT family N-acetyltransferase [Vallitalea okinawensis]